MVPAIQKITQETKIVDALELCPEAMGIMFEHGLHCAGCGGAAFETIEQGCLAHGMDETEIGKIVGEINAAIANKNKEKLF